jgi:hypothetical protein
VCVPTHFVRRRPAMYPPTPAATHWMTMSHTAEYTTDFAAETWFGPDSDANPSPHPRANKISETAAATKPPAMMAGHDTADLDTVSGGARIPAEPDSECSMVVASVVRAHGEKQDDRQGYTQQPKQDSAAHDFVPSSCVSF